MAAFNVETDVSYQAYLTAVASLTGAIRQEFDKRFIEIVCWDITKGTSIDEEELENILVAAKGAVDGGIFPSGTSVPDYPVD